MSGPAAEYVFDTRHDRYPVAAHLILRDPDGRILLMRRAGTEYEGIWTVTKRFPI